MITAVATLILGSVSLAQSQPLVHSQYKPKRPVKPVMAQMKTDLDLSDIQYASIVEANQTFAVERTKVERDENGQPQKDEMRKLKKAHHQEVMAVLKPEQRTKAAELRRKRSPQRLDATERGPRTEHK